MKPYYTVEPVDGTPDMFVLRCVETGQAYPNGPDRAGKPFMYWRTPEGAKAYAGREGIPLLPPAPPDLPRYAGA